MIRAILKRQYQDAASGMKHESFITYDFDEQELEALLLSGGFGEHGFESTTCIGLEIFQLRSPK